MMIENPGNKVPSISDVTAMRWKKENQYPCGTFEKCKKCTLLGRSSCSTWDNWFKKTWSAICQNATKEA